MGFLTSGLTEAQQSHNQQNFQLGMSIGVNQATAQLHAQTALAQMQAMQEAEGQRQLANIAEQNESRKYVANQRLLGIQEKSAADFTAKRLQTIDRYLTTATDNVLSGYRNFSKRPDIYSPETVSGYTDLENKTLGILSKAQLGLANTKPGEDFDFSGFTDQIASLPKPNVVYNPGYLKYQQSRTDMNEAHAEGTGGFAPKLGKGATTLNPVTGMPQVFSDWQDAITGYHGANANLSKRKVDIDASERDNALDSGRDPFSMENKALETASTSANQWGVAAMTAAQADQGDVGRLYQHLRKKGIQPFTPQTVDQVGSELNKIYSQQSDDKGRNAVSGASLIFTGKPIEAFTPAPVPVGITLPHPW